MLLSRGADPYLTNELDGSTPLRVISGIGSFFYGAEETLVSRIEKKQEEIEDARNLALRRELRTMIIDRDGTTPPYIINKRFRDNGLLREIFEFSLDKSQLGNVNVRDKEGTSPDAAIDAGETPLHVLCRRVVVRGYDDDEASYRRMTNDSSRTSPYTNITRIDSIMKRMPWPICAVTYWAMATERAIWT
ncbi:hypothetical protein TKK_0010316 [Trichogramma kaykai]